MKIHDRVIGPGGQELVFVNADPSDPKKGILAVEVKGSNAILAGEPKPAGKQGDTLLEYNTATKETKVYKYISGDWREL